MVHHAFAYYEQLRRIRAQTDLRNARSIRVLEKLGFTHEGTLRANTYEKGEFVDEAVFGLFERGVVEIAGECGPCAFDPKRTLPRCAAGFVGWIVGLAFDGLAISI